MSKTEDKMTAKQRAFSRAIVLGDENGKPMSISDCYRECYNTENMSDAVIRNEASKLASHRGVTMMVERLRRERERSALAQTVNLRERVTEKLLHALDHGADPTTLTAARMLGESVAMFKQHQTVETVRSSDDLLAELDSMLDAVVVPDESPATDDPPDQLH